MKRAFQSTAALIRRACGPLAPIHHEVWELVLMRLAFAALLLSLLTPRPPPGDVLHPYGLARVFDLAFLAQPDTYQLCHRLAQICIVLYALGVRTFWSLGGLFLFLMARAALNNSQGFIGHAGLATGLAVLGHVAASGCSWLLVRPRWRDFLISDGAEMQLCVDWTRQAVVGAYIVAGITKLMETQGAWLARAPLFLLQVCKVQGESWYGFGRSISAGSEAFLQTLIDHPWLAYIFLGSGLLLELFAFLALLGRRLALVMGLCLLAFHQSLDWLMDLAFTANQSLLIIFFINPVWWIVQLALLLFAAGRKPAPPARPSAAA
ncbi:MAG: hypothetical protein K1X78_07345 [Verrucomicrobiaceae bacterium]|nr:hypothetical protein [Verrucomicrobiaceae bacterium]